MYNKNKHAGHDMFDEPYDDAISVIVLTSLMNEKMKVSIFMPNQ
jgi:hypothetical protein